MNWLDQRPHRRGVLAGSVQGASRSGPETVPTYAWRVWPERRTGTTPGID